MCDTKCVYGTEVCECTQPGAGKSIQAIDGRGSGETVVDSRVVYAGIHACRTLAYAFIFCCPGDSPVIYLASASIVTN